MRGHEGYMQACSNYLLEKLEILKMLDRRALQGLQQKQQGNMRQEQEQQQQRQHPLRTTAPQGSHQRSHFCQGCLTACSLECAEATQQPAA